MHIPAVDNGDLAAVTEMVAITGDGHASKGSAAEVEVGAAGRAVAAGALVRYDNGDGLSGAYGLVEAPDFVAGPTALPSFEQNWAHCPDPGTQWLHIHQ